MSEQIERLMARMNAIPIAVRAAVLPALEKSGSELATAVRIFASGSKDSGALISSVAVTSGGDVTPLGDVVGPLAVAVTAGNSEVDYGLHVEFGTVHSHAEPFFWPAYRASKRRVKGRIKRAIAKAVKESWNK